MVKFEKLTYNQKDYTKKGNNMVINIEDGALQYYQKNQNVLHEQLLDFLRIPSVSTSVSHKPDIQNAADFLVNKLSVIGFDKVKAYPTPMHPIIYAEKIIDTQKPTILVYGHYDVQPPDPIDEWRHPPFDPHIENDYLFARGASDMKGQIWASIAALESILKTNGLPVNVKFLIEGEEEIGSPSLDGFLTEHKNMLNCDIVLNPDAGMLAPDKPTVIYALRGMAYFELRIYGPSADLHSGIFGGVIENPANVLSRLIAGMHDDEGRVALPGFYQQVRPISAQESEELSKLGMDENAYLSMTGVPALGGETGFEPVERIGARPTLDVNGLYAGYIEKGAKTIIPAYAMAKISTRLVPDQDPETVHTSLQTYLEKNVPKSVRWELDFLSGAPAYIAEEEAPGVSLFIDALKNTWGVQPLRKREGGSIPVATSMKNILGVDSIITGFGLPDDQIHSPNERMHLPTHQKGVEALIRFFLGF
jgi:acetylornithine deacetylase/succinyl-diaminopimelate desuccinylase-like protein